MGKFLGGHILLVCCWIEAPFTLTIRTRQKLFKENEGSSEHKQSILLSDLLLTNHSMNYPTLYASNLL